ncbi:MAG TPA: carboxypeptidase-like regulatory domain-containing protein, partial [Terriglobales bacterium]|nr:carboxypeptidase-like regulatory domain-containing protein [Terriglobales bacterium]
DLAYEALVTSRDGGAITSELSLGTYHLLVRSRGHDKAEFALDVPLQKEARMTKAMFEVLATPMEPAVEVQSACVTCSVASANALQAKLRNFRGAVMDPSGAVIPNVEVDVLKTEDAKQAVARLKTDDMGQFSAELAPGEYFVTFRSRALCIREFLLRSVPADGRLCN